MDWRPLSEKIAEIHRRVLGENLVGVYLHGSAAFGCFRWETSDLDFLTVVRMPMPADQKERLMSELLALEAECPPKGMEMSAVLAEAVKPFLYPTPYELHYSPYYREECRDDMARYCRRMHGTDRDLAAHVAVILQEGIVLSGQPIDEVFGAVSREAFLDSVLRDVEDATDRIIEEPVYYMLNLCRVIAAVEEEKLLSKAQAAVWGAERFPNFASLIKRAGDVYAFGGDMETEGLTAFATEMNTVLKAGRTG